MSERRICKLIIKFFIDSYNFEYFKKIIKSFRILQIHKVLSNLINSCFINLLKSKLQNPNH